MAVMCTRSVSSRITRWVFTGCMAVAAWSATPRLGAQQWDPTEALPCDGQSGDDFGFSLALSGDRAIVGARFQDGRDPETQHTVQNTGAAYIFRFTGGHWIQEAKLMSSDRSPGSSFGNSVDIDGDAALVGAWFATAGGVESAGAAYVYRLSDEGWSEEGKLTAPSPQESSYFAQSVALRGGLAIVGSPRHFGAAGAAYVYRFDGTDWVLEATLGAGDSELGDSFGTAVALSPDGTLAVVGANSKNGDEVYAGAVYVFRHDGEEWVEEAKLTAPGTNAFGSTVAAGDDVVLASVCHNCVVQELESDRVYVFRHGESGWNQEWVLTPTDGAFRVFFGLSISIDGDRAVVGAPDFSRGRLEGAGAAYVYRRHENTWIGEQRVLAPTADRRGRFGWGVAVGGERVVVSASGSGRAFFYDPDGPAGFGVPFIRGDCNVDGSWDISDPIELFRMLFLTQQYGTCLAACDANADGFLNISDGVYSLGGLFQNAPLPPPPRSECGTPTELTRICCESFDACD